ncbi:MAG: GDCCVxC domain-containing (seleno)protein [Gammaproteobacteria bacterium]|jgi:uncharacterized C2H2 Zn-finger protein
MQDIVTESILTCPVCGYRQAEQMPEDSCTYYWSCPGCGTLLRPRKGDCCVFCSYGTVPCPPVQKRRREG